MLEVLDPSQNSNFVRSLSQSAVRPLEHFFICNGEQSVRHPAPLRDRMEVIGFSAIQ